MITDNDKLNGSFQKANNPFDISQMRRIPYNTDNSGMTPYPIQPAAWQITVKESIPIKFEIELFDIIGGGFNIDLVSNVVVEVFGERAIAIIGDKVYAVKPDYESKKTTFVQTALPLNFVASNCDRLFKKSSL